jgi:C-terminal lipocalin-like domain
MKKLAHPLLQIAIFVSLLNLGCGGSDIGGGGGGDPVATRSDVIGTWTGSMVYGADYLGNSDTVTITIASNGTITGTSTGSFGGAGATITGTVDLDGTFFTTYVYPAKVFSVSGQYRKPDTTHLNGTLTWQQTGSGSVIVGPATFALTKI